MMLDTLDAVALKTPEIDVGEKLEALHTSFQSSVKPENGFFGEGTIDVGNGISKVIGRDQEGRRCIDYQCDGQTYKRRVNMGNGVLAAIEFDDNGAEYLRTIRTIAKDGIIQFESQLAPDKTIVKGNYTAQTDHLGRPTVNRIENLQLKSPGLPRQSLSPRLRDSSYRVGDERGHLISDQFGGPSTGDNIVAQSFDVNRSKMRRVEELVEKYKGEGHRVDYSVETKYVGSDGRPSSFEPHIVVDGDEVKLDDGLAKIYNDDIGGPGVASAAKRATTRIGERFGLAHEEGLGSAKVAAAITCSVSAFENISSFVDGDIGAEEMATNILGDTAAAGGLAYGASFVTETAAQALSASSNQLIKRIGGSCAPALVVSFGVESFGDISDFAQGRIDAGELAYNLGENAAEVVGGAVGGAIAGAGTGALVGTFAGPIGTAAGTVVGSVVGGVVGCAVASEAYASAVELGSDGVEMLGEQVERLASATVDAVAQSVPEQVENARDALDGFFESNELPFCV